MRFEYYRRFYLHAKSDATAMIPPLWLPLQAGKMADNGFVLPLMSGIVRGDSS